MSTENGIPPAPAAASGYGDGPKTDAMATVSLILGILSVVFFCSCFIGWPLGGTAIILGLISRSRISKSDGSLVGGQMAVAGLILGCIAIGLGLVLLIFSVEIAVFDMFQQENHPPKSK